MPESSLYSAILAAHSHGPTRLWRFNAGLAYQGRVIHRSPQRLILDPWYPVKLAAEGMSDLLGWTIDEDRAIFTAIECKIGRRTTTPAQDAFLALVQRSGGRSGVARSVEDASAIIHRNSFDP